jgi:hypothetical protein
MYTCTTRGLAKQGKGEALLQGRELAFHRYCLFVVQLARVVTCSHTVSHGLEPGLSEARCVWLPSYPLLLTGSAHPSRHVSLLEWFMSHQ